MTEHDDLERVLVRWFGAEGLRSAPAGSFQRAIEATRTRRPRPALVAGFGSAWVDERRAADARRVPWGAVAVLVLTLVALVAGFFGGTIVGGRLASDPPHQRGVIAFTTGTWGWGDGPSVDGAAIFTVSPDGGEPTHLVDLPGEPLPNWHVHEGLAGQTIRLGPAVRWSPGGARLAFRLYNDQAGIWVIDRDGSGLRLVADATGERSETTDQFNSSFTWSPDGSRIAFISPDLYPSRPDAPRNGNGRLRVVAVDNGDVHDLSDAASGSVAWSPDGSQIAFGRSGSRRSALVIMNADGTGERAFDYRTPGRSHPGPIAWSPDGSLIAFVHARLAEATYVVVVNSDGTEPREVIHGTAGGCCYHGAFGGLLEWSPDGTLIATPSSVFAADGSGERLSLPGHFVDWSPDGSQLAFSGPGPSIPGAPDNRSTAIYVIDADGTDQRWLANGDYPAWSP